MRVFTRALPSWVYNTYMSQPKMIWNKFYNGYLGRHLNVPAVQATFDNSGCTHYIVEPCFMICHVITATLCDACYVVIMATLFFLIMQRNLVLDFL